MGTQDTIVEGKAGEITEEFVRLNACKEELHNRIGVLIERLQDLLRKPEPTTVTCPPEKIRSSQFAIDLSSITCTIETDLEKVDDVLNRLEL